MPTPRRRMHTMIGDKNGVVPTYHTPPSVHVVVKRCERCDCILASDNIHPICSPCQRKLGGMPEHLSVYGYDRVKPRR